MCRLKVVRKSARSFAFTLECLARLLRSDQDPFQFLLRHDPLSMCRLKIVRKSARSFAFTLECLARLLCSGFGKLHTLEKIGLFLRCQLCACFKLLDGLTSCGEVALREPDLPTLFLQCIYFGSQGHLRGLVCCFSLGPYALEFPLGKDQITRKFCSLCRLVLNCNGRQRTLPADVCIDALHVSKAGVVGHHQFTEQVFLTRARTLERIEILTQRVNVFS